ncbi:hypothetical protein BU26DRAFT_560352 [Trematosphaeria pertusa]|uniref:Uncharacterized protein n=1 Tax=Trematosphaeria pertusa TaxID=390896 RepID=A0A6A6ISD5_9PLEO|nr:uncharacterized protein BU26DRAFT_560352 [Trematosphaeria pertusa]KAF2253008.1 hypothetical protein BU26DRAFT_560352 [Trematosphaeria pertusa]
MKFSLTLLAAAASAAAVYPRDDHIVTSLASFKRSGCQADDREGSPVIYNVTVCQNLPTDIVSCLVDITPPEGCAMRFFCKPDCQGPQYIDVPQAVAFHNCFECGPGKGVASVVLTSALGTCNWF